MKKLQTIVMAADHGGFELKEALKEYLIAAGHPLEDLGATDNNPSDHPIFAKRVVQRVLKGGCIGILICGSSQGITIAANRFKGIRAISAFDENFAQLGREHHDANILCLAGRFLPLGDAKKIVNRFLKTEFLGGHYKARIKMFDED